MGGEARMSVIRHRASREAPPERELDGHLRAAGAIRARAERVQQDFAGASAGHQARALRALTEQLVTTLVPMLDAEEQVVCRLLGSDLQDPLRADYRRLRGLAERLSILSENAEATRRRVLDLKPVVRAVNETVAALDSLERHQRTAFSALNETLSLPERGEVDRRLEAASLSARAHTLLVVQPAIPARASTVLRHRPDLDSAHVISVAALDERSRRS